MMRVQASPALREASPSVYRLAVSVAMLAWPDLFASVTALEEHTGLTRRTVLKGLKALEALGFLESVGWQYHEGGCYTRRRRVHWDALGTVEDADETLSRRRGDASRRTGGEHTDTTSGEHTDTRMQQGDRSSLYEGGMPTGVTEEPPTTAGDPQAGFEGEHSDKRTEPEGPTGATETERGTSAHTYSTDLEAAEGLRAIGLAPQDAYLYVHACGPDLIRTLLVKMDGKQGVKDPPAFFTSLLKRDYLACWLKVQKQRHDERSARGWPSRSRPRSKALTRGHPHGCTCEECFGRIMSGNA